MTENITINLGDEVQDQVSGFMGIAVARHHYLQGCNRISVQPLIDKDGKLPDTGVFDEPSLDVITPGKVTRKTEGRNPGGPEKYSDIRRY